MVLYSHMYPKLVAKGLIIDIGDQAMLRGVLKAGLEQVWSSFGHLLGVKLTPLGVQGGSKWARRNWYFDVRYHLHPRWYQRGLLAALGRAQERSGGVQFIQTEL